MIKMNKLMQEELLKIKDIDNTFDFTGKLSVINPEMYKVHDCVLMRINDKPKVSEETIEAAMKYKDFNYDYEHSEFLIGSYFEGITYEQSLRLGLDIVELWGYKLHALFPEDEFHIIMSVDIESEYYTIQCVCSGAYSGYTLWDDLDYGMVLIDPDDGKLVDISEYNYFYHHVMGSHNISYSNFYGGRMVFNYSYSDYYDSPLVFFF